MYTVICSSYIYVWIRVYIYIYRAGRDLHNVYYANLGQRACINKCYIIIQIKCFNLHTFYRPLAACGMCMRHETRYRRESPAVLVLSCRWTRAPDSRSHLSTRIWTISYLYYTPNPCIYIHIVSYIHYVHVYLYLYPNKYVCVHIFI